MLLFYRLNIILRLLIKICRGVNEYRIHGIIHFMYLHDNSTLSYTRLRQITSPGMMYYSSTDNSNGENDTDPLIALSKSEYDECLARLDWVRKNYCSDGQTRCLFRGNIRVRAGDDYGERRAAYLWPLLPGFMNWCLDRIAIDYGYPAKGIAASHYGVSESDGLHRECLIRGGYHQLFKHMAEQKTPPLYFTAASVSVFSSLMTSPCSIDSSSESRSLLAGDRGPRAAGKGIAMPG